MSSINSISVDKLSRLVGTPRAPVVIDVRTDGQFSADRRLIPGSIRKPAAVVSGWPAATPGRSFVVVCGDGTELSPGTAALLRTSGRPAEALDGGLGAWAAAGQPFVKDARLPRRDAQDRAVWVTRERPKIDRIACPWLIRRFVDPWAVFLFVAPRQIASVAERCEATPFDVEDVFWSHRAELCTFHVMLAEFGLGTEPLQHLARIVRGADTARPDLAPEPSGLLAASLGLSRMFTDDLEQLEAGLLVNDALYRWTRDARAETHDWFPTSRKTKAAPASAR